MKKLKFISIIFIGFGLSVSAQLEIDHSIKLTGSDTNAAVTGIKSVVNPLDATNIQAIQNGGLIYGNDTGSNNAFYLSISPVITAYRAGMVFSFVSNQSVTGPATVNVDGLGAVNIYKNFNKNLNSCDIQTGQVVMIEYDGANFQMISQLSGGQIPAAPGAISGLQTVTANEEGLVYSISAVNGAGSYTWSLPAGAIITSGDSSTAITVTWASTSGNVCVAANGACGSSSNSCIAVLFDTVNIDTSQKNVFTATGADQTWLVPNRVNTIKVKLWGAGGGGYWASGGSGSYVSGFLAVTPGQTLTIVVGKGGANGGSYGGGGSAPLGGSNGGGGRSAIQITPGTDAVTAGGGGGAGGADFSNPLYLGYGGAGGALTGGAGGEGGGSGGTQNAGGAYGCNNGNCGSAGSSQTGGEGSIAPNNDVCEYGGGGGGGYYGGGGGGGESSTSCGSPAGGGGGGSSFVANLTGNVLNTQGASNNTGAPNNAPNNNDPDYILDTGRGLSNSNGDDGEVVIYY